MNILEPLLLRIADLCFQRYKLVLILAALGNLAAILILPYLRIDPTIASLIPKKSMVGRFYHESKEDFGDATLLVVAAKRPATYDVRRFEEFVELLAGRLSNSEMIRWVQYRLPSLNDDSHTLFAETALLRLNNDEMTRLTDLLSDEGIHQQVRQNKDDLGFPNYLFMKRLIKEDPLSLRSVFNDHIRQFVGNYNFSLSSDLIASIDRKHYLIMARPTGYADDLEFCAKLVDEITTLEARAREDYGRGLDEKSRIDVKSIEVGYAGRYIYNAGTAKSLKEDFMVTFVLSLVGVLLLYYYAFHRHRTAIFIAVSLITGLLWTAATAFFIVGSINFITCAGGAILTGLTIDYGIHLCNRYEEEFTKAHALRLRSGQVAANAIRLALGRTGKANFIAAVTTSASFLSLSMLPNDGIAQLGLIAGAGIFLCMLSMMTVLPSLLIWHQMNSLSAKRIEFKSSPLIFDKLPNLAIKYPIASLVTCLLITLLLGIKIPELKFGANVRHLLPRENESIVLGDELTGKFGGSLYLNSVIVIEDSTLQEALLTQAEVDRGLRLLLEKSKIASYETPRLLLPDVEQQKMNIDALLQGRNKEFSLKRIKKTFYDALDGNGFIHLKAYEQYLNKLHAMLSVERPLTLEDIPNETYGEELSRFVNQNNGRVRLATYVWPSKNIEDVGDMELFTRMIEESVVAQTKNAIVTGPMAVLAEISNVGRREFVIVAAITLIVALGVLLVQFRDQRLFLLPLLLVITGWIWTLGLLVLLDTDHALAIICGSALIIGIGIDDGVHIVMRNRETGDLMKTMNSTARPIVLTSLTTMIAFGSLILANQMTLHIIGMAVVLGTASYLLISLILIPSILSLTSMEQVGKAGF